MKKNINGIVAEVVVGDIMKLSADLIVLPEFPERLCHCKASQSLWAAGYGGAVNDYLLLSKKRACSHGDTLFTYRGVNLAHVVTEGAGADGAFDCVFRAMQKVFCEAHEVGYRVIAVPELGTTGKGGITPEQSAIAVFAALLDHTTRCDVVGEGCRIEKVIFVTESGKSCVENVLETEKYLEFLSDECLGLIEQRKLVELVREVCDM